MNIGSKEIFGDVRPYDCQVEYLKSTGTQWIDTGIKSSGEMEVEVELHTQYVGFISNNCYYVYGYDPYYIGQTSRETAVMIGGGTQNSAARCCSYGGDIFFQANYPWPNEKTVAKIKDLKFSIDDVVHYTFSSKKSFTGGNCYLFACNQPGTDQVSNPNMSCYGCKIWLSKQLVRNFVPVKKDEIGYMYDKVSGELFGNAGTGKFILGPDVK